MGSRYYITGVQLGMLMTGDKEVIKKVLEEIYNKQFIGRPEDVEIKRRKRQEKKK